MISEKGRVVAIDSDCLWVETIQQSTCGSCAAKKGCGQSLLAKIGVKTSYLRVLLQDKPASEISIDDEVLIGIPDDIIVKSSLFAYLVPIALLLLFSSIAQQFFAQELYVILLGLLGLLLGGVCIKFFSYWHRHNSRYQPVLLGAQKIDMGAELNNQPEVIRVSSD